MPNVTALKLNLNAMRGVYTTQGSLTAEQFAALEDGTRRINALDLGGVIWHIPFLARDTHGHIPWNIHLQAWAAGLGHPYAGIEDFYKRAVAAGVFPAWLLNRTVFYQPPPSSEKLPIGRLLMRLGLISVVELERALGIQMLIKDELGLQVRVGRVLGCITRLSLPDMTQAITLHFDLPYVNLEQTLPVIERVVK